MIDLDKKESFVVFGTGLNGITCIYDLKRKQKEVSYCLSNDEVKQVCGIDVYLPDKDNVRGVYILVAVRDASYLEVALQLESMGLKEFENFIFYKWLNKKMVLLHGNCHIGIISAYLKQSKEFSNRYAIYPNLPIHKNRGGTIKESILLNCDVWIHQDIREDNAYGYELSDVFLKKIINKDSFEIVIPNLYGYGSAFFPELEKDNINNSPINNGQSGYGMFPFRDNIVEECFESKMKLKDIIAFCRSDDSLCAEAVLRNFEINMNKIKEREKDWDIKIYDFIMERYKKEKLFYDVAHPTNVILKYIAVKTLKLLNIDDDTMQVGQHLGGYEYPVYPSVKKCLGLEWSTDLVRNEHWTVKVSSSMNLDEYIKEYLWWCHGVEVFEEGMCEKL